MAKILEQPAIGLSEAVGTMLNGLHSPHTLKTGIAVALIELIQHEPRSNSRQVSLVALNIALLYENIWVASRSEHVR